MVSRFLITFFACLGIPALATLGAYRVATALHWPWWMSCICSALCFWYLFESGQTASRRFLEKRVVREIPWRECTRFLARHALRLLSPFLFAAVAYCVFPVLLPPAGTPVPVSRWPESLLDVPLQLKLAWQAMMLTSSAEAILTLRYAFALIVAAIFVGVERQVEAKLKPDEHLRGRKPLEPEEAEDRATNARPHEDPGIIFGGLPVPSRRATLHFLVLGSTGSGKTLTLQLMMQSALSRVGAGQDVRAFIFDAKRETLSLLAGMGIPFKTFNMFDERSVAWDMAKDITDEDTASAVAEILIPKNERASQPYFDDAARELVAATMTSFIDCNPDNWTFRDVIYTVRNMRRLRQVLGRTVEGQEAIEAYLSKDSTALDVMSTVANKTKYYKAVAAAWSHAKEKISLRDWVEGDYALVLGNSHVSRSAVRAINQVIFKRVSELLLEQEASTTRRTWVFLDELRQAGRLDGLESFAVEGRSRGVCLVLGTQDLEGLQVVYGEKEADELLGMCGHKAILQLESPQSAEWASKVIGKQEVIIVVPGWGGGPGGPTWNESEQRHVQDAVLPSELMDLSITEPATGLTGYYISRGIGCWKVTLAGQYLSETLIQPDRQTPDFVMRPRAELRLKPWGDEDASRLGLSMNEPSPDPKVIELEPRRELKAMGLKRGKGKSPEVDRSGR
jgi:type IV secretory pathway TraG/TraD family ATPase VirD4